MAGFNKPSSTTLETPRLRLEPLEVRHIDDLWEVIKDSWEELRQWLPWVDTANIENTRDYARTCEAEWAENKTWAFVILKDDKPIGTVGLADSEPQTKRAELGYWTRSAETGKGYMFEAASAVIEFGFKELGLHRIELEAGVGNAASIRVAEKLGFQREGVAREAGFAAIGFHDTIRFGLLSTDPRPFEKSGARV